MLCKRVNHRWCKQWKLVLCVTWRRPACRRWKNDLIKFFSRLKLKNSTTLLMTISLSEQASLASLKVSISTSFQSNSWSSIFREEVLDQHHQTLHVAIAHSAIIAEPRWELHRIKDLLRVTGLRALQHYKHASQERKISDTSVPILRRLSISKGPLRSL